MLKGPYPCKFCRSQHCTICATKIKRCSLYE
jgi:hypothetical protein